MCPAPNPAEHDFRVDKKRVKGRSRDKARANRLPGHRDAPPVVIFPAESDAAEAALPPVRIFLGTEPAQLKAERVFLFSVKKHRNPGRRYEVYLMKDLVGFDRTGWATGFTNYRYAIPFLAGQTGRAIYNDVDQIYVADPAELFDRDMAGAALLAIDDAETSVMLMDCEKLAPIWSVEDARKGMSHDAFRARVHEAGLWGHMPWVWNSRDTEFDPAESKLLHYTTLHKQPWKPFPEVFDYAANENAAIWDRLEAEADTEGYLPFSREHPSPRYTALIALYETMHTEGAGNIGASADQTFAGQSLAHHIEPIAALLRESGARTLLDYGSGKAQSYAGDGQTGRSLADWPDVAVTCFDPGYAPFADDPQGSFDAVISTDVLEHVPEEDVPWVLNDMFRRARKFVYINAACYPAKKTLPNGENAHCTVLPPTWWRAQMEIIGAMHPGVDWELHAPLERRRSGLRARIKDAFAATQTRFRKRRY